MIPEARTSRIRRWLRLGPSRLDILTARVEGLTTRLNKTSERLNILSATIDAISGTIDAVIGRLDSTEGAVDELIGDSGSLTTSVDCDTANINTLAQQVVALRAGLEAARTDR